MDEDCFFIAKCLMMLVCQFFFFLQLDFYVILKYPQEEREFHVDRKIKLRKQKGQKQSIIIMGEETN